jgi:hypothetical protein
MNHLILTTKIASDILRQIHAIAWDVIVIRRVWRARNQPFLKYGKPVRYCEFAMQPELVGEKIIKN